MKRTLKALSVLLLLLFLSGCSSYDAKFSYFNMLDAEKRTVQNKKTAEKFWSSVRPVSTLSASHYKLGRYYQQQGKYAKAIEEFSKALHNDSRYCKAYNGIAMCYDALRHYNTAHDSYEQAIQCDPQEAYLYNNYALSSLLCGDYDKGLALLLKALQLSGENNRIKNNVLLARGIIDRQKQNGPVALQWEGVPFPAQTHLGEVVREDTQAVTNQVCELAQTPLFWERQSAKTVDARALETVEAPSQPDSFPARLPLISRTAENKLLFPVEDVAGAHGETTVQLSSSLEKNIKLVTLIAEKTKKRVIQEQAVAILRKSNGTVEVSNGNGVAGMAQKSATYFRGYDFKVSRITNAEHFRFADSVIFYKEGYLQVAVKLAMVIPGFQEMEKVESLGRDSIGVRVLLGSDLVAMHFPDGYALNAMVYDRSEDEYLVSSTDLPRLR